MDGWRDLQLAVCRQHGVSPVAVRPEDKVGVARNVRSGDMPINGVRVLPEQGASGWYIWAGEEMLETPDFFEPLHASHLPEWCPAVIPFLRLPPGWRFLVAGEYSDAWFDASVSLAPT